MRAEAQSHGISLNMTIDPENRDANLESEEEELEDSDHDKSDEEELATARKLENQLNLLAEDPDLLEDLKRLKRTTKNVQLSA